MDRECGKLETRDRAIRNQFTENKNHIISLRNQYLVTLNGRNNRKFTVTCLVVLHTNLVVQVLLHSETLHTLYK